MSLIDDLDDLCDAQGWDWFLQMPSGVDRRLKAHLRTGRGMVIALGATETQAATLLLDVARGLVLLEEE
jgi:hypothetical protein